MLSECEYELAVRHDTCAPRHRLWFHFSASNHRPNQKVLFHVVNFSKSKSLYKDGMSPTVRTASQLAWARLHPKNVFYYKSTASRKGHGARASEEYAEIDGARRTKNAHVLSFVHVFSATAEPHFFCYSYPFTYAHQQRVLDHLERRRLPHVERRLLCRSVQHRRCDVVVVDASARRARGGGAASLFARKSSVVAAAVDDVIAGKFPSAASLRSWKMRGESSRKVVLVSCRVHPGETPASHALRGFLDFIASDDDEAASLRRAAAFVVVPMLNPDGCALGNYRTDSLGQDLNRAWTAPTRATEPTLEATKRLARRFAEDPAFELVAYVDCHAHTSSRRSFLFCNPPEDASDFEAWERAAALPRLIDARGGGDFGFSLAQCKFCAAPDKAGAGRRAVGEMLAEISPTRLGTVACYTLEMSFYSVPIAQKSWSSAMSDDACYEGFGGVLGRAFVDLFERGDNPKAAAIMRRVARAAEVKRALDDARKSDDGDGDGDVGDDGGTKGPGRATASAAAAAFHVTGDAMFGFGCGAFASEHRLGTVDRAKRAASARPSRANVGGVSGGVSVSVASPPRWNVVANVAGASIGADLSAAASRTKPHVGRNRDSNGAGTRVPRASTSPDVRPGRVDSESTRRFARASSTSSSSSPNAGGFARRAAAISPTTVKLSLSSGEAEGDGSTLGMRGGVSSGSRARAKSAAARRAPDYASTTLASETMLAGLRLGGASEKVRVMKGDATVAASGSASSPADDPQRWGALPRERRDGETRFGEKSARERVDPEGPFGLDAELAAAQAHFEASREER